MCEAAMLCPLGRWYTGSYQNLQVMLVADGHDGLRACELVQRRMPSVLLRQLAAGATLATAMHAAFMLTEKEFFVRIDANIMRKITLQDQISVCLVILVHYVLQEDRLALAVLCY